MEISGVYIQSKTRISPTYRLLFKQGHLYSQMYEDTWEFNIRDQPYSETPPIQVLHTTDSAIRVPIMVLQQSPLSYPLKILGKMQRRATIWILGCIQNISY